jgi:hypothetical protein
MRLPKSISGRLRQRQERKRERSRKRVAAHSGPGRTGRGDSGKAPAWGRRKHPTPSPEISLGFLEPEDAPQPLAI